MILTFVGYVPYIRDTLKGKTHPHAYSWFVWGLIAILIFALQTDANAGPGAYVMLSGGAVSLLIFGLALRFGKQSITKTDTLFFVLALVSTGIWVFAEQPILALILLWFIDMFGLAPTIRKSWHKPYSETLFLYQTGIIRHGLSILAIVSYNFTTLLFPVTWVSINSFMTIMLTHRRRTRDGSITPA